MNATDRPINLQPQPTDGLLPWLLSISATPSIAVLLGGRSCLKWLEDVGIASEEVFRGDRLPVLHFPTQNEDRE